MKVISKMRMAWLAAVLAGVLSVLPATAFAETVKDAVAVDSPSTWAAEDVAYTQLHQLAAQELFAGYQAVATKDELQATGLQLQQKLAQRVTAAVYGAGAAAGAEYAGTGAATRQDAAIVFYRAILQSLPQAKTDDGQTLTVPETGVLTGEAALAVRYISEHGILQGKQDGRLDLADPLTREQMFTLAYRTYDYVLQATNSASKGLAWKVTGGKSPVYLLGSIHIADISLYPLDNLLQEAYRSSAYLAVEADVTQDAAGIQYLQQKAVYADGSTLDQHVSADTYKLFVQKMEQAGLTPDVYKTLKPWYAAILAQNLALAEASYSANYGLDVYFLSDAAKTQKPVLQVEGIKFQVDMFDSFDSKLQEEFLLSSLNAGEEAESGEAGSTGTPEATADAQALALQTMLDFWKSGNAGDFGKLVARSNEAEIGASEFNRIFWDGRNKNMYRTVEKYLTDPAGKSYFVVVGAGHMFGDTGVLKELEKAGYTLEQLLD